jgi:hypothetical protein
MRFFTMTWWRAGQESAQDNPAPDYWAHLASLRKRIPKDQVQTLDALESVAVHDARLRELRLDPKKASLRILLDAYWEGGRMTLSYTGVKSFVSTADPTVGLGGPYGYGDVGYDRRTSQWCVRPPAAVFIWDRDGDCL